MMPSGDEAAAVLQLPDVSDWMLSPVACGPGDDQYLFDLLTRSEACASQCRCDHRGVLSLRCLLKGLALSASLSRGRRTSSCPCTTLASHRRAKRTDDVRVSGPALVEVLRGVLIDFPPEALTMHSHIVVSVRDHLLRSVAHLLLTVVVMERPSRDPRKRSLKHSYVKCIYFLLSTFLVALFGRRLRCRRWTRPPPAKSCTSSLPRCSRGCCGR